MSHVFILDISVVFWPPPQAGHPTHWAGASAIFQDPKLKGWIFREDVSAVRKVERVSSIWD